MDSNSRTPMEKPQFETLPSLESSIRFHRHRRSHLKSETFRTLVQIFSHCYDYSQRSLPTPIVQDKPKLDNDSDELGKVTEKEARDELDGDASMERDDMVVDESTEANYVEGGGSNQVQMVMDELENMMNVDGNEEVVTDHCTNLSTVLVDNNQTGNGTVEFVDSQENFLALEKFLMEESNDVKELPVDNGHHSLSKDVELSFDKGIDSGDFEAGSNAKDKTGEDKKSPDEPEHHELQQKDKELEKSVCICDKMGSPIPMDGNEEMEEGEIYGELGLCEQSVELLEDTLALEEEKVDMEQVSEDDMIKEMVTSREQKRRDDQDAVSNYYNLDIADDMDNSIEYEVSNKMDTECKYKMAVPGKRNEDKKADGYNWMAESQRNKNQGDGSKEALNCLKTCPGDIALHRNSSEENAYSNGGTTSAKKDFGVRSNKKKRSGSSETKKEKEKRRKKLKRAEKNRQLGVKRLKLQPVLKPKVIKICNHYLKGRCQKGDQCSFSHDAVPLTKSTPCCHFARKSCMKGDACPFDHELSKYPCDKFLSNGVCIRGDACMFSHKMPVKDGSLTSSNVCKPEPTSPFLPGSTDSKKQLNSYSTIPGNMDTGIYPCKNTNQNVAATVLKPPAHPPKGMSFLSFGKSPLDDSCKFKQGGSSPKGNNKVGNQLNPSALNAVQSFNEVQNRTPPAVAPKGKNIFSFGIAPSDYSSSKKQTGLPSYSENGIVMSPLNNSSKINQVGSPMKGCFRIGNQHEQTASETIQNMREISKQDSPALATPGINPFSLSKDLSDTSIKQQTRLHINKDNNIKISSIQRQSVSDKLQYSSPMPLMLSVSPLPSVQSLGRLSDGHRNMASSAQKALLSTLAFAARWLWMELLKSIELTNVLIPFQQMCGALYLITCFKLQAGSG